MQPSLPNHIARHILRDLATLRDELDAYPDDETVWKQPPGAPNSAGTLALHMAGNLQHFIGAGLADNGYVRDREGEFGRRDVPRSELIAEVRRAEAAVAAELMDAPDSILDGDFPLPVGGRTLPRRIFLLHLTGHLSYHLGQVDYHRRLVTGDATSVGAMSPFALVPDA